MSDGRLRLITVATALHLPPAQLDIEQPLIASGDGQGTSHVVAHVVIEEIENGLHPSQAGRLLELLRQSYESFGTRAIVTTHSPALLDEIDGKLNPNVAVIYRNNHTGRSEISPLMDLGGYEKAVAEGTLGRAVTAGKLIDNSIEQQDYSALNDLLGIR